MAFNDKDNELVICEEVFDEKCQPSAEEIVEHAIKIGINPEEEPNLLYLAKEGLMQALPTDWKICYSDKLDAHYYYNEKTKATQWDHPLDAVYRNLVSQARRKNLDKGKTLDTSEDISQLDSGIRSSYGNEVDFPPNDEMGKGKKDIGYPFSNKKSEVATYVRTSRFEVVKTSPQLNFNADNNVESAISSNHKYATNENCENSAKSTGFIQNKRNESFIERYDSNPLQYLNTAAQNNLSSFNVKGILRDSNTMNTRRKIDYSDYEDKKIVRFNLENTNSSIEKSSERFMSNEHADQSVDNPQIAEDEYLWNSTKNIAENSETSRVKIINPSNSVLINESNYLKQKENASKPILLYNQDSGLNIDRINYSKLSKEEKMLNRRFSDIDTGDFKNLIENEVMQNQEDLEANQCENINLKSDIFKYQNKKQHCPEPIQNLSIKNQENLSNHTELENRTHSTERNFAKSSEQELEKVLQFENQKYEKRYQAEIENIKIQHNKKIEDLKHEYKTMLETIKLNVEGTYNKELEDFRTSVCKDFDLKRKNILEEHKNSMEILQSNHADIVQELERDLKSEEELLKKEHASNLLQMKEKLAHDMEIERQKMRETGEDRLYEKTRCEKRLLEDKYRCLKEKYIRLKNDVKSSLEKRSRRREEQILRKEKSTILTIQSDTDRSTSYKPMLGSKYHNNSPQIPPSVNQNEFLIKSVNSYIEPKQGVQCNDPKQDATNKLKKKLQVKCHEDTTSISQSETTISNNHLKGKSVLISISDNGNSDSEVARSNHTNNNDLSEKQRKKILSRMKSASTSILNTKEYKVNRPCTPIESLRTQLQKLEDLEDQFPDNTLDTTYHLRYPFSDISNDHAGTSSELEFFKHRIHLERDSVRRAKDRLRTQRLNFRVRQREIKQRHRPRNTTHPIDQLMQEEKEIADMEVNLHRTRALLGEKVIRLRHLEQSLQRIYENEKPVDLLQIENKDDTTISDLSSHSSSGFSSTDFPSDPYQASMNRRREICQDSSDCIQSLEILNAEIREILDILSLSTPHQPLTRDCNWTMFPSLREPQVNSFAAPHTPHSIPTLADRLETYRQLAAGRHQTLGSATKMAAHTIVSQNPKAVNYTTSLVERTRDLRNWLMQAKTEYAILTMNTPSAGASNLTKSSL